MQDAARALASRAPIDLTLANPAQTEHWASELGGVSLGPGHVRLASNVSITDLPGFAQGAWWVQDIAASLPARIAGAGAGRHAIDLCAAPGGKTMQLAAQGWRVTALDKSAKRLERMGQNLERSGLSAQVIAADALQWQPDAPVDLILLDAPCSATGIFRRHPDVLYRVGPRQIAEMAELQLRLLDRVADWLAPGGTLIYATCSLERAEGEDQIAAFLARHSDYALVPVENITLTDGIDRDKSGFIRTLPGQLQSVGGLDGFFVGKLIRN